MCHRRMAIVVSIPSVEELDAVVHALREWQDDADPLQLHPGDVGWFWRFGDQAVAAAVRTWRREGSLLAVGLLDGDDLLRVAFAPGARDDEDLAHRITADVVDPARGVLPAGEVSVESPTGSVLHDVLGREGWPEGDPWTVLRRDLTEPVESVESVGSLDVRIEVVGPAQAEAWAAVQQSAFANPRAVVERWHAMAAGVPFADARSLLAHDGQGNAVASAAVWSAGPGRPGILEPMGVHADHRGRGHATAITLGAAAALRDLGAASAMVATPSANVGAVAAYLSAGFERLPERYDRTRPANASSLGDPLDMQ